MEVAFRASATHVLVRRAVAQTVDAVLLLLVAFFLPAGVAGLVIWLVIMFGYFGVFQGVTGTSLGKHMLSVRVVNAAGSPPGWLAGVKRTVPLLVEYSGIIALAFMTSS